MTWEQDIAGALKCKVFSSNKTHLLLLCIIMVSIIYILLIDFFFFVTLSATSALGMQDFQNLAQKR